MLRPEGFPGFEAFHVLKSGPMSHPFHAELELGELDGYAVLRGEVPIERAEARWVMGRRVPGPVVRTTWGHPVLLAPSLVQRLRDAAITGFRTYDVALHGKDGASLGTYHGLIVTGRCGPLDVTRCMPAIVRYPAMTVVEQHGAYFDESSWDGSDIFMPRDTGHVFVSERAKAALATAGRHVGFRRLADVDMSPMPALRERR